MEPPATICLANNFYVGLIPPPTDEDKNLIELCKQGFEARKHPKLELEGSSASYKMYDGHGKEVAIFKPIDEEMGCEKNPKLYRKPDQGFVVGGGAYREVFAYIVDKKSEFSAGVPITLLVQIFHSKFNYSPDSRKECRPKIGSLQLYIHNKLEFRLGEALDVFYKRLCKEDVNRLVVLDLRIANVDRTFPNLLLLENSKVIPIDHGCALPNDFMNSELCWHLLEQASEDFDEQCKGIISSLNPENDFELIHSCTITLSPKQNIIFLASNYLLIEGAALGMNAYALGSIMTAAGTTLCGFQLLLFDLFKDHNLNLEDEDQSSQIEIDIDRIKSQVRAWLLVWKEKPYSGYLDHIKAKLEIHSDASKKLQEKYRNRDENSNVDDLDESDASGDETDYET